VALNANLRTTLSAKGLSFVDPDREAFRDALGRTDFYRDWKAKLGDEAWAQLESVSGKLV
jgi:TRAP-type C4-dicarboxylate transport system substrate-binding protein